MQHDITASRLLNQHIAESRLRTPEEVVAWLGGVQAQDYNWAKWSVGLRLRGATDETIERAVANRRIVRTWVFRGTLHFVAAADVEWITALVAPTLIANNKRRYKQLELDDGDFAKSKRIIEKALTKGKQLKRSEIVAALEAEGISAQGQRAPYLLQRATLDGLICQGPPIGRESVYVLLHEWTPPSRNVHPDEALGEITRRYFASHGPASLEDLKWWSGLSAAEARRGLESVKSTLVQVPADGEDLWATQGGQAPGSSPAAYLLPPFDEYLLGYKNRAAALEPGYVKRVNAGGGMLKPTIVVNGRVAGIWNRAIGKHTLKITSELFQPLDEQQRNALNAAAFHFGSFHEMPVFVEQ